VNVLVRPIPVLRHSFGGERAAFKGVLPVASLAGQSPCSGTAGLLGAIAAFVVFVLFGLNGMLGPASQCSAKRALALASSHALRLYRTTGIKANAAIATATMIQAIRKRGGFMAIAAVEPADSTRGAIRSFGMTQGMLRYPLA
jgi:hypothetical protein